MKVNIEFDIPPEELSAASDLVKHLSSLFGPLSQLATTAEPSTAPSRQFSAAKENAELIGDARKHNAFQVRTHDEPKGSTCTSFASLVGTGDVDRSALEVAPTSTPPQPPSRLLTPSSSSDSDSRTDGRRSTGSIDDSEGKSASAAPQRTRSSPYTPMGHLRDSSAGGMRSSPHSSCLSGGWAALATPTNVDARTDERGVAASEGANSASHGRSSSLKRLQLELRSRLHALEAGRASPDAVAAHVNELLEQNRAGRGGADVRMLVDVLLEVALDDGAVARRVRQRTTCMRLLEVVCALDEQLQSAVKESLLQGAMATFRVRRPADCEREEFYGYAEAVAALVALRLATISAAVKTITALLKIADNRAAAITLLGKTVELCAEQLRECDPRLLSKLRVALANIKEQNFAHDIAYVVDNMQWRL